ncbi:HUS1 checkpoint protein [Vigna unguiculata]|uniref:HUS1 checkpoint protein n=1 Tax=Vigna unguiculata TaxID=3917 RepID=A0A4D6M781_VIGUN|nr:HUS1 checkpoint protein [Vigna unguiculata]
MGLSGLLLFSTPAIRAPSLQRRSNILPAAFRQHQQRSGSVPTMAAMALTPGLQSAFVTDNGVNRISSNNDDRITFALDLSLLLRDLCSAVAIPSEYSASSSTATRLEIKLVKKLSPNSTQSMPFLGLRVLRSRE